jgi:23S rRNA (cytidine1920-2'-O)/16S rRNA (cytidine1409-2'-O)-methyltransferase
LKHESVSRLKKVRLDQRLFDAQQATSREQAKRMIMAGEVSVNGSMVTKPGAQVTLKQSIVVKEKPRYVSRGGDKLAKALDYFDLPVNGFVCADVGASTGGFTDCLLQGGAVRVYAVDVGYGQLDWRLRNDPRVVSMERTNVRNLNQLPELVDLCVIDVSFISLRLVLPIVVNWLKTSAKVIALIKPQFEAGRSQVGKGGVVKDPAVHVGVLDDMVRYVGSTRLTLVGLTPSPLRGPSGNIEFLMYLATEGQSVPIQPILLAEVVTAGHSSFEKK